MENSQPKSQDWMLWKLGRLWLLESKSVLDDVLWSHIEPSLYWIYDCKSNKFVIQIEWVEFMGMVKLILMVSSWKSSNCTFRFRRILLLFSLELNWKWVGIKWFLIEMYFGYDSESSTIPWSWNHDWLLLGTKVPLLKSKANLILSWLFGVKLMLTNLGLRTKFNWLEIKKLFGVEIGCLG